MTSQSRTSTVYEQEGATTSTSTVDCGGCTAVIAVGRFHAYALNGRFVGWLFGYQDIVLIREQFIQPTATVTEAGQSTWTEYACAPTP